MYRLTAVSAVAAVALLSLSHQADAQTQLRFGHANGEGEIAAQLFQDFADSVAERTDGELTIQIFPNEQLGNENELVEQAKAGGVDITAPSMPSASLLVPSLEMPSAPFLWDSWEEAQATILGDAMQPAFDELADEHDLIPLSKIWYWGWRNFTFSDTEVRSPADMEGLSVRVPEQAVWVAMVEAFGASPTPIAFSDVYSALQQGVVDGQENPIPTIYNRRFYEVQDYLVMSQHMLQNNMILMNQSQFESLSTEHQRILLEEAQKYSAINTAIQQRHEEEMLQEIEEAGGTTVIRDPDRAAFADAMTDAYASMAERWGPENFERLQASIEELRSR
ncbi:TRAP transporter substrate-binding protein [Fodinicurvata sp. EGI_FJ10296]|uniref:TRAP transporter substrate-binding protein n=1 Tax=Fodinicurvata sp. EGI_FJ10296 TaxID=3231908 RepID=UPI0034557636